MTMRLTAVLMLAFLSAMPLAAALWRSWPCCSWPSHWWSAGPVLG